MSMQQVMEMMRGLQDEMAESRVEQERMQADLADSRARNEELHRVNEELRRGLSNNQGQREQDETERLTPQGSFPHPSRKVQLCGGIEGIDCRAQYSRKVEATSVD